MIHFKKHVFLSFIVLLFVSTTFLAGCGAGRTTVLAPVETPARFTAAEIFEDKPTVNVPSEVSAQFKGSLEQEVFEKGGFIRGDGLKIRYRFIQFNPGSQFSRWFWGGIGSAGKGTMTVEAKFLDQNEKELAKIHSEGEISSGAFGGAFNLAIQKAAKEIAEYAKKFR